jgi:nucleoside-diphosphate-sugar epimerase
MTVLLTGATGLVGPYVLERLISLGETVRVLALPDTVEKIPPHDSVEIVEGSLEEPETIATAMEGVDVVYHLAARLIGSPLEDLIRVNVQGTQNLLDASVGAGIRRFVFTSSVSVYAPAPFPYMWPITEDSPLKAHGHEGLRNYGQSKIDAENLVLASQRNHGLEYVILRPSAVYGPEVEWARDLIGLIWRQPVQALSGQAAQVPTQWVHVRDVAAAVLLAGTRPRAANHVFNIAGADLVTARDIVGKVRRPAQGPLSRRGWDRSLGGHSGFKYDFSKAEKILGYTPQVDIGTGVRELVPISGQDGSGHVASFRPNWQNFLTHRAWGIAR